MKSTETTRMLIPFRVSTGLKANRNKAYISASAPAKIENTQMKSFLAKLKLV